MADSRKHVVIDRGVTSNEFVFAYDTTTQTVATKAVFQDITFNTNGELDGWSHSETVNPAEFTCSISGKYKIFFHGQIQKNGGTNALMEIRLMVDAVEEPGTAHAYTLTTNFRIKAVTNDVIVDVVAGEILKFQFTADIANVDLIVPVGTATETPSCSMVIQRLS